jgi:hypothetical protein
MKDFKKISDKELDDLFKGAADNSSPEFEESAWDKMESMLDDSDIDKGGGALTRPLIYGTIILLLLSFAYFTKDSWKDTSSKDETKTTENKTFAELNSNGFEGNSNEGIKKEEAIIEKTIENNDKTKQVGETIQRNTFLEEKREGRPENENINSKPLPPSKSETSLKQKNFLTKKKSGFNSNSKPSQINMSQSSGEDKIGQKEAVELNINVETSEIINDEFEFPNSKNREIKSAPVKEVVNLLKSRAFAYFETNFSFPSLTSAPKVILENEALEIDKWGIRLAISPDLSSVPANSFYKIGHDWAALVEYRLNERWSFQTGLIKSLKFYNANPDQYLWPERWGTKPAELNQIDARCNMLDIPINVRYDISVGNNRWFVQAGLTNYLMLNEKYDYVYASNYTNETWGSWEGKTGFYGAAVTNFSFGIEKKFNKRLTFQAEPFVKIPLANVGFGKVKLITTGLFISSKYTLFK